MAKLLNVEENQQQLPILCIYGYHPLLTDSLIKESAKKFRIIVVADLKPVLLEDFPEIYFIATPSSALLSKLSDTINYAVFFAGKNDQYIPVIEKFKSDKTHTLLVLNILNLYESENLVNAFSELAHVRFSIIGEVITHKKPLKQGNLSKIIENVILNGEIRLSGNDVYPVYGISREDALTGIGRLLFGKFRSDTFHFLFYKHPQSVLETAHFIGRINPDIKLFFSEHVKKPEGVTRDEMSEFIKTKLNKEEDYIDSSFTGLEKELQHFFDKREEFAKEWGEKGKKKKSKRKRKIMGPLKFAFISIFWGFCLFLVLNLLFFGLGLFSLNAAVKNVEKNNFKKAAQHAKNANILLTAAKPTILLTFDAIGVADKQGKIFASYMLLGRAGELAEIAGKTFSVFLGGNNLTANSAASAVSNFSFLYQEAQRMKLETDNKTLSNQLKETYGKLLSLAAVIPEVLGFGHDINYLILFQNSDELRPTGGFIGSVGDLTVKEGKVEKLTIQDVYELDGQLRNHIEPPFVVRRYLQPHLYLRDSNFYLDFQQAASTSALIYNLESGKRPDAVIAVNLRVLKEVLKITGPITLPNYNVTVTADTVSQFLQNTIQGNFFPGSTQKRDVLNSLFNTLVEKSTKDSNFYVEVVKLLPDLLEQKDILFSYSDNSVQRVFSANDYAGEQTDKRPQNVKVINDYLYINEANIGINKVNANVVRDIKYKAMIIQNKLISRATLNLLNRSTVDDYKAYITFAVPKGSSLTTVKINGVVQQVTPAITDPAVYEADDFKAPTGLETERYEKGSFGYFAFIVNTLKNKKTVVEVEYTNGAGKEISTIINYSLMYVKQPGTEPYNMTATLDYPEGYAPVKTSADSYGNNFLETTYKVDKDLITEVELRQK